MTDKILTTNGTNCALKELVPYADIDSPDGTVAVSFDVDSTTGKKTFHLDSAKGPQGDVGAQGTQGVTGSQGDTGTQGAVGSQGTQGTQGDAGSQGAGGSGSTGSQGSQGVAGTQGDVGSQGAQGAAGSGGGSSGNTSIFTDNGNGTAKHEDGGGTTVNFDPRPKKLDETNRLLQVFKFSTQDGNVASGATYSNSASETLNAGSNAEGYNYVRVRIFVSDNLDDGDGKIINAVGRSYIDGVRINTVTLDVESDGNKDTTDNTSATSDTYLLPLSGTGDFTVNYEQRINGGSGSGNITAWAMLLRVYPVEMLYMK